MPIHCDPGRPHGSVKVVMMTTVVYAGDEHYARIMAVSISSLLSSTSRPHDLSIVVIGQGFSRSTEERIRNIAQNRESEVRFIQMPDLEQMSETNLEVGRFSLSTYSRLWLSELLPEIDQVTYIDCDTVFMAGADALLNDRLGSDIALAGVPDAISRHNKRLVGLNPNDLYVNAGVLKINLAFWRENEALPRFLGYLKSKNGRVPHNDQGVLNACLAGSIEPLDLSFNMMSYCLALDYDEVLSYKRPSNWVSRSEFDCARAKPRVLHATGSFLFERPWVEGSNSPIAAAWNAELEKIRWPASSEEPARGIFARTLGNICTTPARKMALNSLGLLQATVRHRISTF